MNFNLMSLEVVRQLEGHDQQSICQLHYVEVPSLQVTQHFTDKVHRVLNLVYATQLLSLDNNSCADHVVCRRYVKLQDFVGLRSHESGWGGEVPFEFLEVLLNLLSPLKIVLLLEQLEERESPDTESKYEMAQGYHATC
jgi:hypothetical protein